MDGWLKYLVIMFYQAVKEAIQNWTGLSGILIDLCFMGLGYWKRNTDWGEGLFYGALSSFGRELTAGVLSDIMEKLKPQTTTAQRYVIQPQPSSNVIWY